MGAVVLDVSVVIALLDPTDALHRSAVMVIEQSRENRGGFILPASVLAEVLVGAVSRGDVEHMRRLVVDVFGPVRVLDEATAVAAALRRSRHPGLRLPDAIVLATVDVDDAESVLTGDRRWLSLDKRVVVIAAEMDTAD